MSNKNKNTLPSGYGREKEKPLIMRIIVLALAAVMVLGIVVGTVIS
jgi:hypothetical protein